MARKRGDALLVRGMDTAGEHRRSGCVGQRGGRGGDERIEPLAFDRDHETGIGAELPRAHRQRPDERRSQRRAASLQGFGQQDDRVDARHLGIDRNGDLTALRQLDERQAAGTRSGEADRSDARILHQRAAEIVAGADQMREHTLRQTTGRNRGVDRAGNHRAGRRMRRVALDDDRATGSQRRCGVATGGREGERKIARAEHRDRAERDHPEPQIGTRQRCAIGERGVDPQPHPAAATEDAREQLKLADGTAALALEPCARQAAFAHRGDDQVVAERDDLVADPLQEIGPRVVAGRAIRIEGGVGGNAGGLDVGWTMDRDRITHRKAGSGIDGSKRRTLGLARACV